MGTKLKSLQAQFIGTLHALRLIFIRRLRKIFKKRLLPSSYLSLCPHGTSRPPLDGISRNSIFDYFWKICRENSRLFKTWQAKRVIYMKTNTQFWSYVAHFFLEWGMFQTKFVEKIETHWICFEDRTVYEVMWKNIVEPERPQMTVWPCAFRAGYLRLQTHTHLLTLSNTYGFSPATVVARPHLSVTLHGHCLSCLTNITGIRVVVFWVELLRYFFFHDDGEAGFSETLSHVSQNTLWLIQ